jgi:serine/threonine-protein kinase
VRTRRHTEPGFFSTVRGRRLIRDIALLLGVFIVGYGLAYLWLAPKRLFIADHAVPRVLELSQKDATEKLEALDLRVQTTGDRPHPSLARGTVIAQDPAPGTIAPEGAIVHLTVSSGPPQTPVPDVTGFAAPQATRVLQAAGFKIGGADSVDPPPGTTESGVVMATRPGAGAAREPGAPIQLVVTR